MLIIFSGVFTVHFGLFTSDAGDASVWGEDKVSINQPEHDVFAKGLQEERPPFPEILHVWKVCLLNNTTMHLSII